MKAKNITYWITTTFLAADMALAGVLYLTRVPLLTNAFAHLGYPPISQTFLVSPRYWGRSRCLHLGYHVLRNGPTPDLPLPLSAPSFLTSSRAMAFSERMGLVPWRQRLCSPS
jgi:hypothetical protein